MKKYYIKETYIHRDHVNFFDDTNNTDAWQKEVYEYALALCIKNDFKSVMDIGTGSAFKLLKYFSEYDTLGIDLPKTIEWLNFTYPHRRWSSDFSPKQGFDIIIASDVIEHLLDPDDLLNMIIECAPKFIILSTPDRDTLPRKSVDGPPVNGAHVREWSFEEFYEYVSSKFNVIDHFISNKAQATQVVLAKPK